MKRLFEIIGFKMVVIETESILRDHISRICIPDLVDGKDLACVLVFGDSIREIVDPLANEGLDLSNSFFGEPAITKKRSVTGKHSCAL